MKGTTMYPEDSASDAPQNPWTSPAPLPTYPAPPTAPRYDWASSTPSSPPEAKKNRGLLVMVVVLALMLVATVGGALAFVGTRHHSRTELTVQEKTQARTLYYSMLHAMKGVLPSDSSSGDTLSQIQSNCEDYKAETDSWMKQAEKFGVAEIRTGFIALTTDVTQFFTKCAAGESVADIQIGGDENTLETALANQGVTVGGFGS